MKKKYVKKANCWMVSWQEKKDRKVVDHREFFAKEEQADNFIKEQNEELQTTR